METNPIKVIVYVEGGLVVGARATAPVQFSVWDQDNISVDEGCIPMECSDCESWDDVSEKYLFEVY